MEYAETFTFTDVHDQIIKVPQLWMWIIGGRKSFQCYMWFTEI